MSKKMESNIWLNLILFRRSLIYQTKEFFQNSTLHGVRYIAESGRPIGEKFMWFCFTAIGTITALIIIMSLWEKFQTNPTITGLDTDFHNQQVMFPTTIVCPAEPYDKEKLSKLAHSLSQHVPEDEDMISTFLKSLITLSFDTFKDIEEIIGNFSDSARKTIQAKNLRHLIFEIHASTSDILKTCKYRDEEINCSSSFNHIYTEHGFCYGFNSRFISTESVQTNIPVDHDLYETDKKWSLHILPQIKAKIFILSHEEEFGWDFKPQLNWELSEKSDIFISKKSTYTTDDARQLSIGQRKCIFSDEVKLKYFDEDYTFSSCMKDCRMQKAIKLCKCLPPFFKPLLNTPPCTIKDFTCLMNFKNNITNLRDCLSCELSCSKTVYNVEKLNKNFDKADMRGITVEFLTWPIIRYKREVLFGWVDLLVSFGGIAGLFLGFSLLSGVEIIYYFTMRACCMVYRNRDELYAIEEDLQRKSLPRVNMSLKPQILINRNNKNGRVSSVPSKFEAVKKVQTKYKKSNNLGNKWIKKKSTKDKVFKPPMIKQVKAAPPSHNYYNPFYKSRSEPPQFIYAP